MTPPPRDIKERTFVFAVRVLKLCDALPKTIAGNELARQLIRAATSIGANIEEAEGAESKRDAAHKFAISRKEAREARYWLRILQAAGLIPSACEGEALALGQESDGIRRILSAIVRNIQSGDSKLKEDAGEYLISEFGED